MTIVDYLSNSIFSTDGATGFNVAVILFLLLTLRAIIQLGKLKDIIEFLILIYEELGSTWINPSLIRIGASSLLIDIERQLYHFASGRYANKEKFAVS